jgi:hypothetical protein
MADAKTGGGFEDFGRKIDEKFQGAKPKVEAELQKLVRYINDEVVPDVRREGSHALRAAAEQMRKLAEYIESRHSGE